MSKITEKYVSAKAAKAAPDTTFAVSDYPTRMLRKMVRLLEHRTLVFLDGEDDLSKLCANIKRKMGWK